jgi:LmbE family N-acetylglucosaminyl deacetylase
MKPNNLKIRIAAVVLAGAAMFAATMAAIHPASAAPGDGQPPASPTPLPSPTGTPVLFVAAHPDDETLAMGVAIAEHSGQNVHVLILTYGEASSTLNGLNATLADQGHPTLTQGEFAMARQTEGIRAVAALTAPNAVLHWAELPDGQVTTASAKAAILAVANQLGSVVRIKGHTYISAVEPHPDHRAVGNAILALAAEQPARFSDRRFYLLPHAWGYTGTLPGRIVDYPNDAVITGRVMDAAAVYADWNPTASYGIGMLSTPSYFNALTADPQSVVHK